MELLTFAISTSLTIEIHKNNTDTSSVTNKQYYKKYVSKRFFQIKLKFSERYCQILKTFSREIA